ncbi:C166 family protein [Acidianus manzaensis]|uniref:Uncharacterized protein n=1 Tax=Acidianus manzaensis TaxID=282676 RepID=A0A1W6K1I7_9CREN|nr:C166 family protein [Acidianus manzaensis]ARM76386.1 hypothetical protein B6F84_10385 [Acidianus manzaensis]
MGAKLIVNVIIFDIILALLMMSFAGIQPPSIANPPTQSMAQAQANISWNLTIGTINWVWLWPLFYFVDWLIWIVTTIFAVVVFIFNIFTTSLALLSSVPVIGPFLLMFAVVINFVLIWELVTLIRGTEG